MIVKDVPNHSPHQAVKIVVAGHELAALHEMLVMVAVVFPGGDHNEKLMGQFAEGLARMIEDSTEIPKLRRAESPLYSAVARLFRDGYLDDPPALCVPYDELRDENTPDQPNGLPMSYREELNSNEVRKKL